MATIYENGAEALANGVTPTPGNSGGNGDTAWTAVSLGGGTIVADSSKPGHGSNSYALTPVAGAACYFEQTVVTPGKSFAARKVVWYDSAPNSTAIMQFRNAGGTRSLTVGTNSTGHLVLQNGADATLSNGIAPSVFPTGAFYRIEVRGIVGTTTSNGTLQLAYFPVNSLTATYDTGTLTGVDVGTTNINVIRWGKLTGAYATKYWADDMAYRADGTSFIGPQSIVAPGAPTAVVATAGTLQLTGVGCTPPASNGGNAIQSYTFKASPGGATVTQAGPTGAVIPGLNGNIAYTVTATCNNGFFDSVASTASSPVTVNPGAVTPAPFNRYVAHGGVLVPVTRYRATGGSLV